MNRKDVVDAFKLVDGKKYEPVIDIWCDKHQIRTFLNDMWYIVLFRGCIPPDTSFMKEMIRIYSDNYHVEDIDGDTVVVCKSFVLDRERLPSLMSRRLAIYLIDMLGEMSNK